jgi:WD40-like Beta Propeller Repeat
MRLNAIAGLLLLVSAGCGTDRDRRAGDGDEADDEGGQDLADADVMEDAASGGSMDAAVDAAPDDSVSPVRNGPIIFQGEHGSFPEIDRDLLIVDPESGTVTDLLVGDTIDNHPVWSPDGERVAFSRTDGGNADIYVVGADGTGLVRLTMDPGTDFFPAWSPDGLRLAWCASRDGAPAIYLMNADGSEQTMLVGTGGAMSSPSCPLCQRSCRLDLMTHELSGARAEATDGVRSECEGADGPADAGSECGERQQTRGGDRDLAADVVAVVA